MALEPANVQYNLIMTAVDMAALFFVRRKPTVGMISISLGLLAVAGLFFALKLAANFHDIFTIMRLIAYGLFLHGFIILTGLAIILRRLYRTGAIACAVLAVVIGVIGLDAFAVEPYWLEVSRVRVSTPKLENPVKIVVLSDFQTDVWGEYERQALRMAMNQKPDLMLLPGDYLQEYNSERRKKLTGQLNTFLKEIGFSAKLGVYAVGGDIEKPVPTSQWLQIFQGLPVTAFPETKTLELPQLCITGLTLGDSRNTNLKIPKCEKFHIALGHAPDFALGNVRADLLVAGHTHGGQVRLPFFGPLMTLSQVPKKWAAGVTKLEGARTLVVSRGVGMERGKAPRVRFLCRPDLVVIDLLPA